MSLFKKLFGGSPTPKPKPETYQDYLIHPDPMKEGSSFRVAARIEKQIGGALKTHHLIRADTYGSADAAAEASLGKAIQLIDQQGDRIFD